MFNYELCGLVLQAEKTIEALEKFRVTTSELNEKPIYKIFEGDVKLSKCLVPIDLNFDSVHLGHEQINRFAYRKTNVNVEVHTPLKSAINLNWLLKNGDTTEDILDALNQCVSKRPAKVKISVMGLGDVGATLALGLKLLGGDVISEIHLWDLNENQSKRQAIELNQILVNPEIKVKAISNEALFDADVFVFCASKYVPKVGEKVDDVRMIQLTVNAPLVEQYMEMARAKAFKGLFCIVSDPVDLLCKAAFEANNRGGDRFKLFPEQIRGYGLGVMYARAKYYAEDDFEYGRVFGPHGKDLIVANHYETYDHESSMSLTQKVVNANLEVRALGFKPYIAPAISSGAYSIIQTLRGDWNESAVFLGGQYWGCRNRVTTGGTEIEPLVLGDRLYQRMTETYERLKVLWDQYNC